MAHQALARKYRPRRFDEVTAQGHVSDTLRRAVHGDRVAHAYLFCGPRGVGKTTLARVLAMALNCPEREESGEPCGRCDSCTRIWSGHTALDVVEIDAASNRGVDDARDLRERAMYAPSEDDRFKVYIVDEAHMLTREAWNALLKILEEPPPRVIFIFATTEPQKIQQSAAPILSRCQRFDFRRIGIADIVERLSEVLEQEGADAPEDALRILARKADGGMRDGLSLLDQVLSLTGGVVDQASVRRILGLVEDERYVELMGILRDGRHGEVFRFVESLLDEGYDLVEFYHGFVDTLRTLLRVRLSGVEEVPDLTADQAAALGALAADFQAGDLVRMLSLASELESDGSLRRSAQPRMLLEMLLLRLSYLDRTVELEELIRALGGSSRGPGVGAGADGSGRGAGGAEPERSGGASGPEAPTSQAPEPEAAPGASSTGGEPAAPELPQPGSGASAPESDPEARTVTGADSGTSATNGKASAPAPAASGPGRPDERVGEASRASVASAWSTMLDRGEGLPPGLRPMLRAARISETGTGLVRVGVPVPALERLEDGAVARRVNDALAAVLGREVDLRFEALAAGAPGGADRITRESVREGRLKELVEREPLLRRAVEELDLELLE